MLQVTLLIIMVKGLVIFVNALSLAVISFSVRLAVLKSSRIVTVDSVDGPLVAINLQTLNLIPISVSRPFVFIFNSCLKACFSSAEEAVVTSPLLSKVSRISPTRVQRLDIMLRSIRSQTMQSRK